MAIAYLNLLRFEKGFSHVELWRIQHNPLRASERGSTGVARRSQCRCLCSHLFVCRGSLAHHGGVIG